MNVHMSVYVYIFTVLEFLVSLPKMDQVNVYVAGFSSHVHSFNLLVESCMHGVAKNKKKIKKEKYKYVLIYSTGYFLKEKHQRT